MSYRRRQRTRASDALTPIPPPIVLPHESPQLHDRQRIEEVCKRPVETLLLPGLAVRHRAQLIARIKGDPAHIKTIGELVERLRLLQAIGGLGSINGKALLDELRGLGVISEQRKQRLLEYIQDKK